MIHNILVRLRRFPHQAIPFLGSKKHYPKLPSISNLTDPNLVKILCRQRNWLLNGNLHYLVFVLNLRDVYWLLHLWDHWDLRSGELGVWVVYQNLVVPHLDTSWFRILAPRSAGSCPTSATMLLSMPISPVLASHNRNWKLMQDAKTRGWEHSKWKIKVKDLLLSKHWRLWNFSIYKSITMP